MKKICLITFLIFILSITSSLLYSDNTNEDELNISYQENIEKIKDNIKFENEFYMPQTENIKNENGLFLIFDTYLDPYYIIHSDEIFCLSLEKSILQNYKDLKNLTKYAKNHPIFITIHSEILDYMSKLEVLNDNLENTEDYKLTPLDEKILKNETIIKKSIENKLSFEDKLYILKKSEILPQSINLEKYSKYKNYLDTIDYKIIN
jgi:hypothetical protein